MRTVSLAVVVSIVTCSLAARAEGTEDAPHTGVDLTTLRIMHEKSILSDKEYESALKDLSDTSGALASESNSVVVGKWATTLYGFLEGDTIYDTTQSFTDNAGNAQVLRPSG